MASVNKKSIFILKELVSYRYKNSSLIQLQAKRRRVEKHSSGMFFVGNPRRGFPDGEKGK